jgi:hypothetical protein
MPSTNDQFEDTEEEEDYYEEEASKGWYQDGAYIACPVGGSELLNRYEDDDEEVEPELSAQDAFTRNLLSRYNAQRAHFSLPQNQKTQAQHIIKFPLNKVKGYSAFRKLIHTRNPSPEALNSLIQSEVLGLIKLATQALKKFVNIEPRVSAWLWGLLCRVGEVGTLDSEAVSVLREFGKKAVQVGISFFNREVSQLLGEGQDDDDDEEEEEENEAEEEEAEKEEGNQVDDQPVGSLPDSSAIQDASMEASQVELAEARERLLVSISNDHVQEQTPESSAPPLVLADANTRATLDTIIVIVGQAFGQRDLLEFRTVWAGENGLWG